MKKLVATLKVYQDPDYDNSTFSYPTDGTPDFKIVLGQPRGRDPKTLLAHELGHFVSVVYKDPTHDPMLKSFSNWFGDPRPVIPGERKAWELAKDILGDQFDEKTRDSALGTYLDAAKELE